MCVGAVCCWVSAVSVRRKKTVAPHPPTPTLQTYLEKHFQSFEELGLEELIFHALRALGVSAIDFNFLGSTAEKVLDQMEGFRTSVMARI